MDIQLLLLFTVIILTINLVAVGIYIVVVLKDFRETVKKVNSILDDVNKVSDSLVTPLTSLSEVADGLVQGLKTINSVTSVMRRRKD